MDAAGDQWLLASGTRAGLEAGSPLRRHEWLAVADLSIARGRAAAGTGAVIRAAAPLNHTVARWAARALTAERTEARIEAGKVRTRLALLHRELGDPWPAVTDPALLARAEERLGPELRDVARGATLRGIDVSTALRRLLPWPEAARLDELVPERFTVPSGNTARISYPEADEAARPVVAVKLQECFGWAQTPRLVAGRVPVQFHLLSPARRPLAITDDLASFWNGAYAQVRAEMRGRYPKHPWPEDPWNAVTTARTTGKRRTYP